MTTTNTPSAATTAAPAPAGATSTAVPGLLEPSLEGAGLAFTTGGDAPWVGYEVPGLAHDGTDFAGSGMVAGFFFACAL